MGFMDDVRAGWREANDKSAQRRGKKAPLPDRKPSLLAPAPIKFGYYYDRSRDQVLASSPLLFEGERHVVLFGLNGAGKSTRFLIELLMTASHRSLCVLDVKGELAYQTAQERERYGEVRIINPYRLHGMRSDGFEPLAHLKHDDPMLYDRAAAIADGLIEIEPGSQQYWSESAQGLLTAIIIWEVVRAHREHRPASLLNVRLMMTEPEEWKNYKDAAGQPKKKLVKGLKVIARRMVDEGSETIKSLVGRFVRDDGRDELAGIQSTADTQTQWMLADPFRQEFGRKDGVDFRALRRRPVTVYAVIPAEEITRKRRFTRVLMASALAAHFEPGPVKTLFVLDEFRAAVGSMNIINDMWSLVRGYGVQLMPILQSALQLKVLFNDEWENYVAQAGVVATLGPPGDMFTAEWMSKRCGVTTVMQAGFNLGDGWNAGTGTNAGVGHSGLNGSSNRSRGANFGNSTSGGINFQQAERHAFLPNELMDLPPGHGRLWLPGMGTRSIPFFAPNYWKRRQGAEWVARVKKNPFRVG